jgi:hypothetical protein
MNNLRVFVSFSPLVTMFRKVAGALINFLAFMLMVIFFFGMQLSVLPVEKSGEYADLPYLVSKMIEAFRIGFADFDFEKYSQLDSNMNILSWMLIGIMLMVLGIIMLNFLIAEVSNQYEKVDEYLDSYI